VHTRGVSNDVCMEGSTEHGLHQQSDFLNRTGCPGCRCGRGLLRLGTGKHRAGLGWPCTHHAV